MDRLTQLQECLDKLTTMFYTSVGVIQRDAPLVQVDANIPVSAWSGSYLFFMLLVR